MTPVAQEEGRFEYTLRPASLVDLLDDAVRAHRDAAAAAGLRLDLECDPALRTVQLLMDEGRLAQVLTTFPTHSSSPAAAAP